MNYNEPSIKKKREELSSPKKRRRTTASAVAFRVILFLICAICVSGAGLAYGSFKGIIASAPKNVSLSPKYSSTIIYDDITKYHTHTAVDTCKRFAENAEISIFFFGHFF